VAVVYVSRLLADSENNLMSSVSHPWHCASSLPCSYQGRYFLYVRSIFEGCSRNKYTVALPTSVRPVLSFGVLFSLLGILCFDHFNAAAWYVDDCMRHVRAQAVVLCLLALNLKRIFYLKEP